MTTASERIPVLVTGVEKAEISKFATAAGVSMGEFLRRAAKAYRPSEDEAALDALLTHVRKTTASASKAIDDALAKVAASNKRIEEMDRASRKKRVAV